eukprot:NODE_2345_length_941_cov_12.723094_g1927_i0.p1 GENE.NODE_2345_length_941_cov_12.723094_g1927_i0~~NODE_2345_length_941_cov_12.723094_g1927_i0.p1  ORF type:complete len:106 (+),score=9.68 NODE_2345_length_941_cov_12.723094_g1927_i0:423-740(+)
MLSLSTVYIMCCVDFKPNIINFTIVERGPTFFFACQPNTPFPKSSKTCIHTSPKDNVSRPHNKKYITTPRQKNSASNFTELQNRQALGNQVDGLKKKALALSTAN